MKNHNAKGILAAILVVSLLMNVMFMGSGCSHDSSSGTTSSSTTVPSTEGKAPLIEEDTDGVECEFGLEVTAVRNNVDVGVIDVIVAVKDIKRELDVVEFNLNFDKTLVSGVIKDAGSLMDSFMTVVPMYTLVASDQELLAPRYEQFCYYDSENGAYECRFLDAYQYANAKPGEQYTGLINDKDLVITIPFRILDGVSADAEVVFSVTDVFGTTREDLQSVCGAETNVVHKVIIDEDSAEDSTGNNIEGSTEDNIEGSTEDNIEGNTEDNTEGSTEENTEGSTEENTEDSTGDNTEGSTEENTEGSTEENTEGSTEENTEGSTGDKTDEPTESPKDVAFSFDIEAPKTAVAGEIIDVVITIKDIKQELDAAEFYLDFDEDRVSGVITQSGSAMDVFMVSKPMYTLAVSGIEAPVSRYEQICRYDAENGVYQCKFIDLFRYQNAKPGEKYQGLINDGDLVIKIQFKVLDTVLDGEQLVFSMCDGSVKGTTRGTLMSVKGDSDTASTEIRKG